MKKSKIMMVINDLRCGGAERVFVYIADGLSQHFDVHVINTMGQYYDFFSIQKAKYHSVEKLYGDPHLRHLKRVAKLQKLYDDIMPDVIIAFLDEAIAYAGSIARNCPLIVSERNDPNHANDDEIIEVGRRETYNNCELIVVQSTDAEKYFSDFKCSSQIIKIVNPLAIMGDIVPYKDRKNEIVAVGRLSEQKNYPLMIIAFSEFVQVHPEYVLRIYGKEYGMRDEYIELARRYRVNNKVIFMGESSNVIEDIKHAKMFLMTSNYEGLPNALLEAMGMGIPPICTECFGGIRDLVLHENNGLLVPIGNKNAIVAALCQVAENSELAERISIEATKVRLNFEANTILNKWRKTVIDTIQSYHKGEPE